MIHILFASMLLAASPAFAAPIDRTSLAYTRAYPLAERGYELIRQERHEEALELFERAVEIMPENEDYQAQLKLLRTQVSATHAPEPSAPAPSEPPIEPAVEQQAKPEPKAIVTTVKPKPAPIPVMQTAEYQRRQRYYDESALAYQHRNARENAKALPHFAAALEAQDDVKLRADYAYTLKDEGMREEAADQFRHVLPTISSSRTRDLMRREIQQLEDNWVSYGSVTYRDGLARASGTPGIQTFNDSLQYGFETIYSPDRWQREGRRLQLYGQAFASSDSGEKNFNDNTTQGAFGIRGTPLRDTEWYLYGARLVRIGSQAINDWQLRTTYAYTEGFDIRPDEDAWEYLFITPDISYLTDLEQFFATIEGRYGRSYRMDDWVFTPHLVGAAAHQSLPTTGSDSVEFGPGISIKYWFAETPERAPRGSLEAILQWREPVGSSDDKAGPFLRFVLQY